LSLLAHLENYFWLRLEKSTFTPPPRKILPTPVQLHKASELNVRTYVLAAPQGLQSNKACYNEVKNRAE